MKLYYYRYMDMWLHCFAKSREDVKKRLDFEPEVLLTKKQAIRRANNGDTELADYIESSYLCELMCR